MPAPVTLRLKSEVGPGDSAFFCLKKQLKAHNKRHSKWLAKAKAAPAASTPPVPAAATVAKTTQPADAVGQTDASQNTKVAEKKAANANSTSFRRLL